MHMLKSLYCSLSISWYSACLSPTTKHSIGQEKTKNSQWHLPHQLCLRSCLPTDRYASICRTYLCQLYSHSPINRNFSFNPFFLSPVPSSQHCTSLHFWCACCHSDPDYILCPINHNLCHNSIPPRPGSIKERGEGGENTCSINEGRSQGCNLLTYWSQSKNPPHKTFFHWFVSFFVVFFQDFYIAQSSVIRK